MSPVMFTIMRAIPHRHDIQWKTASPRVSQTIQVPAETYSPTLSFYYQAGSPFLDQRNVFTASITSGASTTPIYSSAYTPHWTHRWIDLAAWSGETITLTFTTSQHSGEPVTWALVDEVTVGSALPDLWVKQRSSDPGALPGDSVTYEITYGNQGGVPARGVQITDTLPAELIFLAANPPPDVTTPVLRWDAGSLAGGSGPFTILVTATLPAEIEPFVMITNTVRISGDAPEAVLANNTQVEMISYGRFQFLPQIQWR